MPEYREIDEKDFPHSDINSEFGTLKAHIKFSEDSLHQEQQLFDTNIKQLGEEWDESIAETAEDLYQVFPQLQRYALFLLAYGIFERRLNLLCNGYFKDFSPELSVKDFSGQGIERAKIYLSKVHNVKAPFQSKEWAEIGELNKLRNLVAHNSGELVPGNGKHDQVKQYCKTRNDIDIHENVIELSYKFLSDSIDTFRYFLLLICDDYQSIKNLRS